MVDEGVEVPVDGVVEGVEVPVDGVVEGLVDEVVDVEEVVGVAVEGVLGVAVAVAVAVSAVLSDGAPLQAKSRDSRGVYTGSLQVWQEGSALAHAEGTPVECFDA